MIAPELGRADVLVVGGGVAGLWTAAHLARAGRRVAVLEKQAVLGAGSTTRAAGGIRRLFEHPAEVRLAVESFPLLAELARTEFDPGFRPIGYLFLATRPASAAALGRAAAAASAAGVEVRRAGSAEIGRRWPYLAAADVLEATWMPDDGILDPHSVVQALAAEVRARGGCVRTACEVVGLARDPSGAVIGARVRQPDGAAGVWRAGAVVDAAGAFAGPVAAMAGLALPLVPCKRQIFVTAPFDSGAAAAAPLTIDADHSFYFRPEGRAFLLSAMEVEPVAEPEDDPRPDPSAAFALAERAARRVPALAEAAVARGWAGYRTLCPDDRSLLGATPGIPGLFLAAGFGGHGITLAPAAGRLVAGAVLGHPPDPELAAAFTPARFAANPAGG